MPIYAVTVSRTLPTDARPFVDHLARRPKRYAASSTRQWSAAVSDDGPSVWTGRALQAENDDLEKVGLALLYPAY